MELPKSSTLFYGDNLAVLRSRLPSESIDLVYLDPPFNSKATYNILFKAVSGEPSTAQIQAFDDFWHWNKEAWDAYTYLTTEAANNDLANLVEALFKFLGKSDMVAYLVMMGVRLLELERVLKPTGSIYIHCDPTASHYLKLLMDAVFSAENFRNEIIWKRTSGHSDATRFGRVHDVILYYVNGNEAKWNKVPSDYDEDYVSHYYRYKDSDGRRWMSADLGAAGLQGGGYDYEWKGIRRIWRCPIETMARYDREGRLYYTKNGVPRLKRYFDKSKGLPLQDVWTNIEALRSWHPEKLGYPTQKPLRLVEQMIAASSDEGDWVLDPFCGCGTAVIAAEKLRRRWIGIDVTFLAINLVKARLKDTFPTVEFNVQGEPNDLEGARDLAKDRYQFQWWALSLLLNARAVGATPSHPRQGKKGADEGVDGWIRFADGAEGHVEKIVVQVKSGHVGVKDIRELDQVVSRQSAAMGLFITLEAPSSEMTREAKVSGFYKSPRYNYEYPRIQIITIKDLLERRRPNIPTTTLSPLVEAPKIARATNHTQSKLV